MNIEAKTKELDAQVKLLKNEVQETLMDIREHILERRNPFAVPEQLPPIETNGHVEQPAPAATSSANGVAAESAHQPTVAPEGNGNAQHLGVGATGNGTAHSVPEPPESAPPLEPNAGGNGTHGQASQTNGVRAETVSLTTMHPPVQETQREQVGLGLGTIAALAQWAEASSARVGKKRLESIVEIYRAAWHVSPGLDSVLSQVCSLADGDDPETRVGTVDCVAILIELDSILGRSIDPQTSLFGLLVANQREGADG